MRNSRVSVIVRDWWLGKEVYFNEREEVGSVSDRHLSSEVIAILKLFSALQSVVLSFLIGLE